MADEKVAIPSTEPASYPQEKVAGSKTESEIAPTHHVEDGDDELRKDHLDTHRVDPEVAKYASDVAIIITPEENSRLKKLVDKRVLSIMIFTYFLQALDKGTMSFAGIMGIQKDTNLKGQEVCFHPLYERTWLTDSVCLVDHRHLSCNPGSRISHQSRHSTSSNCQIPWRLHHPLGFCPSSPFNCDKIRASGGPSHPTGCT